MPLTEKGKKIKARMKKTYGANAERVFYASTNKGTIKGTITGVDKPKKSKNRSTRHA
jgi:hypothetical protein